MTPVEHSDRDWGASGRVLTVVRPYALAELDAAIRNAEV